MRYPAASVKKFTPRMAHTRAARGAKFVMDKKCPNWFNEVDTERLDLASPGACVLGQTTKCFLPEKYFLPYGTNYGNYHAVMSHLLPHSDYNARDGWSRYYGFSVPLVKEGGIEDNMRISWEMLTIAWLEQIRIRKEAVV